MADDPADDGVGSLMRAAVSMGCIVRRAGRANKNERRHFDARCLLPQAGKQASRQAGKQASRQAGK
ncbi:hypothetical protein [Burkholderia multivorans]|uniref:hypothetical protein n=1 Tax=Burkholderia multivorans TaxID=87883 RepID=UPI001FC86BCB|nr:hypothetical protein [Burkholderia multivorans]